jgi:hypothetical protein
LRDFRLVGRVAGQELAALDDMIHAGRDVVLVRAGADEERHLPRHHVLAGHRPQLPLHAELACVIGQLIDLALQPRRLRHVHEQIVDGRGADHVQHLLAVGVGQGQVTHWFFAFSGQEPSTSGLVILKRSRT